jgi:hypothetical protein
MGNPAWPSRAPTLGSSIEILATFPGASKSSMGTAENSGIYQIRPRTHPCEDELGNLYYKYIVLAISLPQKIRPCLSVKLARDGP